MHDVHDVDAALSRPADVTGAIRDIARRELAPLWPPSTAKDIIPRGFVRVTAGPLRKA